jgi:hypothetical protein
MSPVLSIEIPVRTVSLNAVRREHHMAQHRRAIAQKSIVALTLRPLGIPAPPLAITLTRIASRRLDSDNLAGSFKAIRDAIAAWLGLDDGDPRLTWSYAQECRADITPLRQVFSRGGRMTKSAIQKIRIQIERTS